MLVFLMAKAQAVCGEGRACIEEVCCPDDGDCCWTNDSMLLHSIWVLPIILGLFFVFGVSWYWSKKAASQGTSTKSAQNKAQLIGLAVSLLSFFGLHLSIHDCFLPKGFHEPTTPTAVIKADKEVIHPPFEEVQLHARDSSDESGFDIQCYEWEFLSKPKGSAISIPPSKEAEYMLKADLFGDYVSKVTVTNAYGVTASTEYTLPAVPKQKLWIEMFWENAGDDMDLHLVRDPKKVEAALKKKNRRKKNLSWQQKVDPEQTCFFNNCVVGNSKRPAWGPAGSDDDPHLDLDDRPGTGPENINILEPEDIDYLVQVHDHDSHKNNASNAVTVKVYFDKKMVWEGTKNISGENEIVSFVVVNGKTGKIVEK